MIMTCRPHVYKVFEKDTQYKVESLYQAVKDQPSLLILPLDHTFEAEHMGIPLSFSRDSGLYVKEAFKGIPRLDSERFKVLMSVLNRCNDDHKKVLVNLTGYLTLLSYQMPLATVFKSYRKRETDLLENLGFIGEFFHHYIHKAYENGVRNFYYSDPICDILLVGDSFYEAFLKDSLFVLLECMRPLEGLNLYLCPKYAKGIATSFFEPYGSNIRFERHLCLNQIQSQITGG